MAIGCRVYELDCCLYLKILKELLSRPIDSLHLKLQVSEVVKNNPGVSKVSFVGHSLGGLTLRYAIGKLYDPPGEKAFEYLRFIW